MSFNLEITEKQFNPVSISWHNINVYNKSKKSILCLNRSEIKRKHILKNVSGQVQPGHLIAIMGSSGAGKTTLMNVLAARNLNKISVRGTVRLNGQRADSEAIKSVSAYLQQNDLLIPYITVGEHLKFQVLLKLGPNLTDVDRLNIINNLLEKFSLTKCIDTKIGSSTTFKGISGGEAKRLCFASEALTNPSIFFCDEPTSGLDSYMAKNIVSLMKAMALEGKTIICTIHQPSSQVFELFEYLLLMADGRVAYMGKRGDAQDFFARLGKVSPQNYNPSDFYIDQLDKIFN